MTDIVEVLTDQAIIEDWQSVIGSKNIQDYMIQQLDITDGSSVLCIDLPTAEPVILNGYWSRFNERIELMFIRKFEEETFSSVGETIEQKYNNRLFELRTDLDAFLQTVFADAAEIEVKSISYQYVVNVKSQNMDGILCLINYESWQ